MSDSHEDFPVAAEMLATLRAQQPDEPGNDCPCPDCAEEGDPDYFRTLSEGLADAHDALDREILRLEAQVSNWKAVARNLAQASEDATAAYHRLVKAHGLTE